MQPMPPPIFRRSSKTFCEEAEHPGTPGTGPIPQLNEVSAAQAALTTEKQEAQSELAKHSSDATNLQAANTLINQYFNDLSLLVSVRIATRQTLSSEWLNSLNLEISADLVARLPGLAAPLSSKSGDRYFNLVVASVHDGAAELRLSQSHIQGLELAHLASNPTQDAYLTLVQFLVTRQLLMNHASVESLQISRSRKSATVSPKLIAKMQSLGLSDLIADEETRASLEEKARGQLISLVESTPLPTLHSPALCSEIASALLKQPSAEVRTALCNVLKDGETKLFKDALETEFKTTPLLFSAPLPISAKTGSLRSLIGNAKAQTLILALAEIEAESGSLDPQVKNSVFQIIDRARSSYVEKLGNAAMKSLLDQARARVTDASVLTEKRAAFFETLKAIAPEISKSTRDARMGLHVDPAALVRSFAKQLMPLNADTDVRSLVYELSRDRRLCLHARASERNSDRNDHPHSPDEQSPAGRRRSFQGRAVRQ